MKTLLNSAAACVLTIVPASAQSLPTPLPSTPSQPYYDDFGADPFGSGAVPADPFSFDLPNDRLRLDDEQRDNDWFDGGGFEDDRFDGRTPRRSGQERREGRAGFGRRGDFDPAVGNSGERPAGGVCHGDGSGGGPIGRLTQPRREDPTFDQGRYDDFETEFAPDRDAQRTWLPVSNRRTRPADRLDGDRFNDAVSSRPANRDRRPRPADDREPRFDRSFDPSFDDAEPRARGAALVPPRRGTR